MYLYTQFRTNQECFTHRTSNLAIDGEPDITLFYIWKVHYIDDHPVIWFPSVRLQQENYYQLPFEKNIHKHPQSKHQIWTLYFLSTHMQYELILNHYQYIFSYDGPSRKTKTLTGDNNHRISTLFPTLWRNNDNHTQRYEQHASQYQEISMK